MRATAEQPGAGTIPSIYVLWAVIRLAGCLVIQRTRNEKWAVQVA